jgi:periplasmic protein TonB
MGKEFLKKIRIRNLFEICLALSIFLHASAYMVYYIATLPSSEMSDSEDLKLNDVEIDFEDVPPELIGGDKNPAPVEKQEWVEGTNKTAADSSEEEIDNNELSGDGTDKDGYLYSYSGDSPPAPIIDFDLKKYFPGEAKRANIKQKTVMLLIQVDEKGILKSASIVSGKAGYGFDEAAMEVIRRIRFRPGYQEGKPVKMSHRLPITFVLE